MLWQAGCCYEPISSYSRLYHTFLQEQLYIWSQKTAQEQLWQAGMPSQHLPPFELRKHLRSKEHWSCSKSQLKINCSRFTKLVSRNDKVQQIVHQLKCNANVPPILESLLHHGGVHPSQRGIGPATVHHQACCLVK